MNEVCNTGAWTEFGVLMAVLFICIGWLAWWIQRQRKSVVSKQYVVKLKTGETFTAHKTIEDYDADGFFSLFYTVDAASWCETGTRVRIPRSNIAWITFKQLPAKK